MALITVNSTAGGAGTPYDLGTLDSLIVGPSGLVYSNDSDAIEGSGASQSVYVSGTVLSYTNDAIHLGTTGVQVGLKVTIAASGNIQATDDGVSIFGSAAKVVNFGSINAAFGVYIGSNDASVCNVINVGTINTTNTAILGVYPSSALHLINEGTIISQTNSFVGRDGDDLVENSGVMRGRIGLGGGNDTYLGADGRVVGEIDGELGNDRMVAGASVDVMDGGLGVDTLDFRSTGGVRVALDGGFGNTGTATGDTYTGFEVVNGSATGDDVLRGNASANNLFGLGGYDTLVGMNGNDILVGGVGKDLLIGGAGNDAFVFGNTSQGGDTIEDFSNVTGNNDAIRLVAAGFGAGLTVGPLAAAKFWATNTNQAHDGDDRLIFRTTDKTLWFDANGNLAGGGLTMIADLQASAVFSVADIILV